MATVSGEMCLWHTHYISSDLAQIKQGGKQASDVERNQS